MKMIKSKKKSCKHTCYPVEKVIGFYSGKEKKRYYRVQWAPSWVPEENLVGCEKLIEQFFVEENIINKDKDLNSNVTNKAKIKLEEEDYDCWGCEPKSTLKGSISSVSYNENVDVDSNEDTEKKVNESPSPKKPVTRAMMSTTSPPFINSPNQLSVKKKGVNIQHEDSAGDDSKIKRRYHTRQYYRDLRASLCNSTRRNIVPRKTCNNVSKVYNTRQRMKELTTDRDRVRKGAKYVALCVQKLPFGNSYSNKKSLFHRQIKREERASDEHAYKSFNIRDYNIYDRNIKCETDVLPRNIKCEADALPSETSGDTMVNYPKRMVYVKKEDLSCDNSNVSTELIDQIKPDTDGAEFFLRPFPILQTSNYSSIRKLAIDREQKLRKCNESDSFLLRGNIVKDGPSDMDMIPKLKSKLVLGNDNTSSDENDVSLVLPFECDVCEKMFQTSVLLHRHRFIHCENKPFSFSKRNGNLLKENKENYGLGKLKERDLCRNAIPSNEKYSHHLRPRRSLNNLR